MNITFTDVLGVDDRYAPVPAERCLPEWYKQTEPYVGGDSRVSETRSNPGTIKRCKPIYDALTAGYIIRTYADVQVTQRDGVAFYEWRRLHTPIAWHPVEQAELHPSLNHSPYPKWMNAWAIKTPRGYSCLVVPPMHNPNSTFTAMPGIVDTDSYNHPITLPFTLNDPKWEGMIPAGTPIVQVIPFKRESWRMRMGGAHEVHESNRIRLTLDSVFANAYKRFYWTRKEYR